MSAAMSEITTQSIVVLLAGVAAAFDLRTGRIPNWLTLPMLVAGPLFWVLTRGPMAGLIESVGGILLCGFPPFVVYRAGGMPGGDLKMFAGVGGLVGPVVGIEIEFFAMLSAAVFAVGLLVAKGRLGETLSRALFSVANRFLLERWRRPLADPSPMSIRIGPFILAGALIAIYQHRQLWVDYFEG